jgi:predicted component of type VI protein secretion system
MIAAWVVATLLLVAISSAPWENVRASHPSGVIEVTQPRFEVRIPGGVPNALAEADHHDFDIHLGGP